MLSWRTNVMNVAAVATLISIAVFGSLMNAAVYVNGKHFNGVTRCVGQGLKACRCDNTTLLPTETFCRDVGLTTVPSGLPSSLIKLDLTSNNITRLYEDSFENLANLEELILNDNSLIMVHPNTFDKMGKLKRLSMQNCAVKNVSQMSFSALVQLTTLQLDQNEIESISEWDFQKNVQIRNLRLDGNRFASVPTEALKMLTSLEVLSMGSNHLSSVPANSFPKLSNLFVLLLKRNRISRIDDEAFLNLTSLKVLELDENLLSEIPIAVTKLASLQELSVSGNKIRYIPAGILQKSQKLALLELKGNPLKGVDPYAFSNLPKLRKLILSEARELKEFPSLNGTWALEVLRLDRASLFSVPSNLCRTCPKLKSLDVKVNKLARIPDISECKDLRLLDMGNNFITSLDGKLFQGLSKMHDLMLPNNFITNVPSDAFEGLSQLQVLDLEGNQIEYIHPDAFIPVQRLQDLNLGNNLFSDLPVNGLQKLLHLKTFNNANLREFPAPENFPRIQTLVLSYAYHCCAFLSLVASELQSLPPLQDSVIFPKDTEFDMSLWNTSLTDIWPQLREFTPLSLSLSLSRYLT